MAGAESAGEETTATATQDTKGLDGGGGSGGVQSGPILDLLRDQYVPCGSKKELGEKIAPPF